MNKYKLGKHAPRNDKRTLMFCDYVDVSKLPPVKQQVDWTSGIKDWGMMRNDEIGDCTCAGIAHSIQVWTAANKNEITVADSDVIKAYSDISGYNPQTGENDNGANELDVLNYWRNVGINGHKLGAYAKLNTHNIQHVKISSDIFGVNYLGIALPNTAQGQEVWDVVNNGGDDSIPGSWGGHCVIMVGFNVTGPLIITWGKVMQMTWAFWLAYCDEAYALFSNDWMNNDKSPEGINSQLLQEDLRVI